MTLLQEHNELLLHGYLYGCCQLKEIGDGYVRIHVACNVPKSFASQLQSFLVGTCGVDMKVIVDNKDDNVITHKQKHFESIILNSDVQEILEMFEGANVTDIE